MTFCIFRFLQTVAVQNKKQLWLLRPFVAEITFPELGLNVSRFFLSVRTQETDLVSADHIYFGAQDLTETAIRYLHMTNPTDTSIPVQIRFFSDGNGSQTGINDGGLGGGGGRYPISSKLCEARSRLYRNRFCKYIFMLQHFFKLDIICTLLQCSKLKENTCSDFPCKTSIL